MQFAAMPGVHVTDAVVTVATPKAACGHALGHQLDCASTVPMQLFKQSQDGVQNCAAPPWDNLQTLV